VPNFLSFHYPFYQDIHVMVFIGFGFLMTFLKKSSWSAVGFNYFIAAFVIQWFLLEDGFWIRAWGRESWHNKIDLNVLSLINADFAAAAILISFGAVLGKVGPLQLLVMALIEVCFYSINIQINTSHSLKDTGGSITIHTFGAYFGLAVTWALHDQVK